jgi:hypothetical protein
MSVTKGQELGHYRLVAPLGASGMGEGWILGTVAYMAVEFEWDAEQARDNAAKHGVTLRSCHQ